MANTSMIDDMPEISGNFSDEVYEHDETKHERIFLEMFTFVGVLSVTANVLLCFVILKYKKMREDVTNMIFLHFNILQAVYLIATPLTLRVGMAIFDLSPVHTTAFCISYQIEATVMFSITWFLFLLICDWYLKLYYKDTYVRFCRIYKFFVVGLYVLLIFASAITIQMCFKTVMISLTYLVLFACVVLLVLFLVVINIIHTIRKKKIFVNNRRGNTGLAIANIYFLLWSPAVFYVLLGYAGVYLNFPILIILLISLGFSSPVFNLIYLYFRDDHYNVFLKQVFTCKCNEYTNENFENASISYNDANGVQIPEN